MNCCIKYMLNVCVQRVIKPCKCYLLGQFWSRTDRGLGFPHTPDNNHREESGGTPPETKHQIPQLKQLPWIWLIILLLDVVMCKLGNKKLFKLYLKQKKQTFFNLLSHQVQIFCSHHKIKLLVSCSGLKIFILILWKILLRKKYFTEPGCTICMHLWDMKSSKQILNIVVR